ncbi:hypothetical protein Poly24_07380 [Rosistilla carotiformis]|uniref:Uncharacterized protein n=2 Tax=Rosistilla carotiformis TaxID=2528017 RepID=A0A518JND9_9BACT|nr:hypothetical protein Poly24_07380 [Rosistilla carotiformis]
MLWPIVLPFKITFWSLAGLVSLLTLLSPVLKWKRGKTFLIASLLACLAFIPSCAGIMAVLDAQRFGVFSYGTYSEVQDFRIERYLPTSAREITLDKFAMGHRAKYAITKTELTSYLDTLWLKAGRYSAISREELDDGSSVPFDQIAHDFDGLNWPKLSTAIRFYSPIQGDGGGATYYFDPSANIAYHRAGYW